MSGLNQASPSVRLPTPPTANRPRTQETGSLATTSSSSSEATVPPPAPSRPTWATIADDELDGDIEAEGDADMDSGMRSRSDVDQDQEEGMRGMSDEMTDAVGGLMQMAGGGAGPRVDEMVGNGEDELQDEQEEEEDELTVEPEVEPAGNGGRGRGRRGGAAQAGGSGRGRRKTDGTTGPKKAVRKTAVKPLVTTAPITSLTPAIVVPGEDQPVDSNPVDSMEVDEIADEDALSTITASTALDVSGASGSTLTAAGKKRRGAKGGPGTGRGRKKLDPDATNDELEGSVPGTPVSTSKPGGRKKKAVPAPPSNAGDGIGPGPGGVTKNQPQYHVMKKEDGEMCGRADIQFDFLEAVFTDSTKAFSAPQIPFHPRPLPPETKLTFGELYCYTLSGSPRATKSSKEALLGLDPGTLPGKNKAGTTAALAAKRKKEAASNGQDLTKVEHVSGLASVAGSVNGAAGDEASQAGGDEGEEVENYEGLKEGLSRVCMMINVGRINTTFAFYPLMRTMLRSYHSIPSLQKSQATRRALQGQLRLIRYAEHIVKRFAIADAPRLKIMLKAVLLEDEDSKTVPIGLKKIWERGETGKSPVTSISNLLIAFALRPEPAHEKFFSDYPNHVNMLTLFTPLLIKSSERARAFLYVIYHYLEAHGSPNPFAEEGQPDKLPTLNILSQEEYDALGENIDTPEEIQFGIEMKAQRLQCVAELAQQKDEEERVKADPDLAAAADVALSRENTMWPKPKKARGPAANGKKRKRLSDGRPGDASDFLTHEQLDRDLERHDTISHDGSRMAREYSDVQEAKYVPRYTPTTDDDWASGVETLGLDNATVQELINQVNKESYHWNTAGMPSQTRESFAYTSPERHHYTPSRHMSVERQAPPLADAETHRTPPPQQQPPKTHSLSSLLN